MITVTLAERFQPARLGFVYVKHAEVPREIWPVYRHRKILFVKTAWLAIMDCQCILRGVHAVGRTYLICGHLLQLKLSRQKYCKCTFLPSMDK